MTRWWWAGRQLNQQVRWCWRCSGSWLGWRGSSAPTLLMLLNWPRGEH